MASSPCLTETTCHIFLSCHLHIVSGLAVLLSLVRVVIGLTDLAARKYLTMALLTPGTSKPQNIVLTYS